MSEKVDRHASTPEIDFMTFPCRQPWSDDFDPYSRGREGVLGSELPNLLKQTGM